MRQARSRGIAAGLVPGMRVKIEHKVRVGMRSWPHEVEGVVREVSGQPTGIHTDRVPKDDFWIHSVLIEKSDGELSRITFDEDTEVTIAD